MFYHQFVSGRESLQIFKLFVVEKFQVKVVNVEQPNIFNEAVLFLPKNKEKMPVPE
jgi:hypothetical protein